WWCATANSALLFPSRARMNLQNYMIVGLTSVRQQPSRPGTPDPACRDNRERGTGGQEEGTVRVSGFVDRRRLLDLSGLPLRGLDQATLARPVTSFQTVKRSVISARLLRYFDCRRSTEGMTCRCAIP